MLLDTDEILYFPACLALMSLHHDLEVMENCNFDGTLIYTRPFC